MRHAAMMMAAVLAGCIPGGERPNGEDGPSLPRPAPRYPALDRDRPNPDRSFPDRRYRDRPYSDRDEASPPERDDQPQRGDEEQVDALPAPRPAWEARPVSPDAKEVGARTYLIRPGDTLRRVEDETDTGVDAIAHANQLTPPFALNPGQQLLIPGGRYHKVGTGQSGIAIARAYGVPWRQLVEANGLVEPFILRAGQRILIPGEASMPSGPSTAAQRAAAFRLNIDDILTGGEPALATNQAPAKPVTTTARVLPVTAVVAAPARLSGGFTWPVEGRLLSRFGPGQSGERQNGVTIAAPLNTPVRAAADGVVAYVGSGIQSLGGLVIVKHGGNWTSVYGYAAKLLVQRGQAVKKGQTLALSGETGATERPAVHFELRRGRTPIDPQSQLPRL